MRKLQAFIDFVFCEQRHKALEREYTLLTQNSIQLQKEQAIAEERLKEIQTQVYTLRKKLDQQELELKMLDAQEREKKERLEHAVTVKEFQSLTHELAVIAQKKSTLEASIFTMWSAQDQMVQLAREQEQQFIVYQKAIAQQMQILEEQKIRVADQQAKIKSACVEKSRLIGPELLAQYRTMQQRVENPAVPILNASCSACFYALPSQELSALRQGQLVQCKDCYRLLYAHNEE